MRSKTAFIVMSALLAVVIYCLLAAVHPLGSPEGAPRETAFARVMRTGVLRCGYVLSAPALWLDPQTGARKGFMPPLVEELARRTGVKVEWAEEVGFGNMFAGLEAGRYDAICSGAWVSGARARVGTFTQPFLYSYVPAVVRADETRFDEGLARADDPAVRLAVIDGDITADIAATDFPKASTVATPQSADSQQIFVDVMTGKADMTFDEATKIDLFSQKNPGKLKVISADKPLRVFPWALAVKKGEADLAGLLDGGLDELLLSGFVEKTVKANQESLQGYAFVKPSMTAQ